MELINHQNKLKEELVEAKDRLMVHEDSWSYDCELNHNDSCIDSDAFTAGCEYSLSIFIIILWCSSIVAVHVAEHMDRDDPDYLEALEKETSILEKRVEACKSRIMMVTCFDINV